MQVNINFVLKCIREFGLLLEAKPVRGNLPPPLDCTMQIAINSVWFDHDLILNVRASDTVYTVKAQIHNITGYAIQEQMLLLRDDVLQDTETLSAYGISDGELLDMLFDIKIRYVIPLIETHINTEAHYEMARKYEKVGNIGCRLCWCWMSPASEESHWNSKNKHGKRLLRYTGPPDPNNFREVKLSEEIVETYEAEMQQDTAASGRENHEPEV